MGAMEVAIRSRAVARVLNLAKRGDPARVAERLVESADELLGAAGRGQAEDLRAHLLRGSRKRLLGRLIAGRETNARSGAGRELVDVLRKEVELTAGERLELAKAAARNPSWDARLAEWLALGDPKGSSAGLLREAAQLRTEIAIHPGDPRHAASEKFFSTFVCHRFGNLDAAGVRAVFEKDLSVLPLLTGSSASVLQRLFVEAASNGALFESLDQSMDRMTAERARPALIGAIRECGLNDRLRQWAKRVLTRRERTALVVELGKVVESLDLIELGDCDAAVRKIALETLSKSYGAANPRPPGYERRDGWVRAYRKEHDPIPDLVAACRKHSKESRAYVLGILLPLADDRAVGFLVGEWKSVKDRGTIESALRRITRQSPKDWSAWYSENRARLPKQL
jgi:hypothetical protein